jgi:hypothetical protein
MPNDEFDRRRIWVMFPAASRVYSMTLVAACAHATQTSTIKNATRKLLAPARKAEKNIPYSLVFTAEMFGGDDSPDRRLSRVPLDCCYVA